jgi:formate dehydrogenase subunit delta
MSMDNKLVHMANQIAGFFAAQGEARAVAGIGEHILKYWDPKMRSDFLALARKDDSGLDPLVRKAIPLVESGSKG